VPGGISYHHSGKFAYMMGFKISVTSLSLGAGYDKIEMNITK
jgi:hypothetical protein